MQSRTRGGLVRMGVSLRSHAQRIVHGLAQVQIIASTWLSHTSQRKGLASSVNNHDHAGTRKRAPKRRKKISDLAQEHAVPTTRFGRAVEFGSLALGLGVSAAKSKLRLVDGDEKSENSPLAAKDAERIVATLCRVRGAALKLGQMISIQDEAVLPPALAKIFDRVREAADFMPEHQVISQLESELGNDWRSQFLEFDIKPFAAASIGQVHSATLHSGEAVAVKVQYPGVAESIDSDIDNLMMILKATGLLPKGLYIDRVLRATRRELQQECDYLREAYFCGLFEDLLMGMPNVAVQHVVPELTTTRVLTTLMLEGVSLEKVQTLDQNTRNLVAERLVQLTLSEIFLYRLMQTDPNWGNFLYNDDTKTLQLLDFGATIEYRKEFIDNYIEIIHSSAIGDREKCIEYSVKAGFLSGYEQEAMHDAHVKSVMALGLPFRTEGTFDFSAQDVTIEVRKQIPIMLKYREQPPPMETYSLHRKLSGAFLVCARLGAKIELKDFFKSIYDQYHAQSC